MTFKYDNVYINNTYAVVGPYESNGPLGSYFDKYYKDFYFGEKTFEDAETKILVDSIKGVLKKEKKSMQEVDLLISGDLLNQIISSNFAAKEVKIPYLGIYSACASSVEGLIIASALIEKKMIKNCICSVSSHNNAAEKQFRYPVEYGGPKPKSTTFTTTGGASAFLSNEKGKIKVESSTIGRAIDYDQTDAYNMGAVMTPACADTIYRHLNDLNRDISYYDMVYSGDLGAYGKDILKEYMKSAYDIDLKNYEDSATMIFDLKKQPVYAGGSGPACLPLVTYGYLFHMMKEKQLKRILIVATGALLSSTSVNQKKSIPGIAHAISLEVVE